MADPGPIDAPSYVKTPDSSLNCYALDARYSNSNPQAFATTYQKARDIFQESGK
jgi:hypothetical protein